MLLNSRDKYLLFICLFLILFYCSTESKVQKLWLHFEFLFNCITWRLHTALSSLRDSETISLYSLKWICPEVRVSAALRSPVTIQTRTLWAWDIFSAAGGHGRAEPSLGVCLLSSTLTVQYYGCEYRCAVQYYGCKHGCADACKVAFRLTEQVPKTTPTWRRICLNIRDQRCCSYFAFDIWATEIKALCLCFYAGCDL